MQKQVFEIVSYFKRNWGEQVWKEKSRIVAAADYLAGANRLPRAGLEAANQLGVGELAVANDLAAQELDTAYELP